MVDDTTIAGILGVIGIISLVGLAYFGGTFNVTGDFNRPDGARVYDDVNSDSVQAQPINKREEEYRFCSTTNPTCGTKTRTVVDHMENEQWKFCREINKNWKGDVGNVCAPEVQWDISNGGITTTATKGGNSIETNSDISAEELYVNFDYAYTDSFDGDGSAEGDVWLGVPQSDNCWLKNPMAESDNFGGKEASGRLVIDHEPLSDTFEIRINGQEMCEDTVTGKTTFKAKIDSYMETFGTGREHDGHITLKAPYVTVKTRGEFGNNEGEFIILETIRESELGTFATLDDLTYEPIQFPEVPGPICELEQGGITQFEGRELYGDFVENNKFPLGRAEFGESGRVFVKKCRIAYKASKETAPAGAKDCSGYYHAEFEECLDAPDSAFVSAPEPRENPSQYVQQAAFNDKGEKSISFERRIYVKDKINSYTGDVAERTDNPIFAGEKLEVEMRYKNSSSCPQIPSNGDVSDGIRVETVKYENLPDECVIIDVEWFDDEPVAIENNGAKVINGYRIEPVVTGENSGGDSIIVKDYKIDTTITQEQPAFSIENISVPDAVEQGSTTPMVISTKGNMPGGTGFVDITLTQQGVQPSEKITETVEVPLDSDAELQQSLFTERLLQHKVVTDAYVKFEHTNGEKKFFIKEGGVHTYDVKENVESTGPSGGDDDGASFFAQLWQWISSVFSV